MLVVENRVKDEESIVATPLRIDDCTWPHGITPPLRHVRKRRFRKRVSRRAIEVVEEQVEEMMRKDDESEEKIIGSSFFPF
jgi:transcription initiation factor TFIID subunit 7